jgi:hypothetical protein
LAPHEKHPGNVNRTNLSAAPAVPANKIRNKNIATSLLIFLILRLPVTHHSLLLAIYYSTASKNATAIYN